MRASASAALAAARGGLRRSWDYVRAVMGDKAYEQYLDATARTGAKPLSAEDFYVDSLRRRYSTVSRCC